MFKYIQLYFATLAGCVVFFVLMLFAAFVCYSARINQNIIYGLVIFSHLVIQSILLYRWHGVAKLHKITSMAITLVFYAVIGFILFTTALR